MKPAAQILKRVRIPINTKNIKVVALSIIAATTFWFFNALNKSYSATIHYPVLFDFDRNSYVETGKLPDNVQINVSGTGWTIFRSGYLFNAEPIFIKVDNPEKDNKIVGSSIFPDISEGLSDLDLNYVLDDTLYLSVEKIVEKRVLLVIDSMDISLANNHYIISPIVIEFDSVAIRGPRKFIEGHADTVFVKIDKNRIDEYFNEVVSIDVGNDLAELDHNPIRVVFEVERFIEIQKPVVLTKANFPEDSLVVLRDSTILVTYWIRESFEDLPEKNEFIIVVDYGRMVPYDSTIQPLILSYPHEIKHLQINFRRSKVIRLDQ